MFVAPCEVMIHKEESVHRVCMRANLRACFDSIEALILTPDVGNVWDRAVLLLPRADQLWYKYSYMEEQLGNFAGARQIFEVRQAPRARTLSVRTLTA